jgi:addiction module HigA family antidote
MKSTVRERKKYVVRGMELSHPGEILKIEVIESRNLTVEQAAELLGISESQLSDIFNAKNSVQPIATKIAAVFGGTSALWSRLQKAYDLNS